MKWRKTFLTLLAALAFGIAAAPAASARGGFRGGRGWGGRGFGWAAPALGLGLGLGLAGAYDPYYRYYGGYPYRGRGCWRRAVVDTPWGPRVRRIWVC